MTKLLSKDSVLQAKATERKFDIDAGLKLAKKVDELRELRNKEEGEIMKFRDKTSGLILKEIDDLIVKKNTLTHEIKVLERHASNLKIPFDQEWEDIMNERLSELDHIKLELDKRYSQIEKSEQEIGERLQLLAYTENKVKDTVLEAKELLAEATTKSDNAQIIFNNSQLKQASVNSQLDAKANNLAKKEKDIEAKLKDIKIREEALQVSTKELARREKFINDKYQTLLRAEKSTQRK